MRLTAPGIVLTGTLYDEPMQLPEWSDADKREAALYRVLARVNRDDPLSKYERAIVFLESHGVPRRLMAEWLHLSPQTVSTYMRDASAKLEASSYAHAVATAIRTGLIE